jgi:GNAT superfamily N-acetyltransferase
VTVEEWEPVAAALFARLLEELPTCIGQFDAFLNIENRRGRRFYAQQGFVEREHLNYEFWFMPDERIISEEANCLPISAEQAASFAQLYGALFPSAYYSAERVLEMIGQSHQVLVAAEGEQVLGFAVLSVEESQAGEVQFLGVREECRREGYGRRLLLSALDWFLDVAGVSRVTLNVGEELVHARGLYESVGFRLRFTGIGLTRGANRG